VRIVVEDGGKIKAECKKNAEWDGWGKKGQSSFVSLAVAYTDARVDID
jgi:hypothetical protein